MKLKSLTMYFGVVLLAVGLLGFVPAFAPDGLLLGLFEVNALHNLVHLVTGGAAVYAATQGNKTSQMFLKVFGVVYLLVTLLGLVTGDALASGLIPVNMADNLLHVAITAFALYFGFGTKKASSKA
jgi:hypothetical protein